MPAGILKLRTRSKQVFKLKCGNLRSLPTMFISDLQSSIMKCRTTYNKIPAYVNGPEKN